MRLNIWDVDLSLLTYVLPGNGVGGGQAGGPHVAHGGQVEAVLEAEQGEVEVHGPGVVLAVLHDSAA